VKEETTYIEKQIGSTFKKIENEEITPDVTPAEYCRGE
jgi:hypothetical protein